jgi:DNA-binding NarL/FixJ family response regulator
MTKIKVLIADNSYLIREGFRSMMASHVDFKLVGEAEKAEDLNEALFRHHPDVLVIDYCSLYFCIDDILVIRRQFPKINILAVTTPQSKAVIAKSIEHGVLSHLLKDCGKDEIIEAVYSTAKGQKFFCGKILDIVLKDKERNSTDKISCEGVKLSPREVEIIQHVAEGLSNKQIAERLFLSVHTVTTHRKNIMSKLGVNNTAGLMMFAIRENLIESNKYLFASN